MKVSIFTLVKNRTSQLKNLIHHLEQCSPLPDELNVIWMRSPNGLSLSKSEHFQINHKFISHDSIPIAKAKNKGLTSASFPLIGHINVDMLPPRDFIAKHTCKAKLGSITIPSLYIAIKEESLYRGYDALTLDLSKNMLPCNLYQKYEDGLNRSLYFINRKDAEKSGGYDEALEGTGVNDEDFFEKCIRMGLRIEKVHEAIFCQYRANYFCPLNHCLDFIHNASIFHKKWGYYPNLSILSKFVEYGVISSDFRQTGIHVKRMPTSEEINQSINLSLKGPLTKQPLEAAI
ncbi:hypothetical protein HHX48_00015 [Salinimonas sp. HHU 13199]|uniref:Glycosyltransferase n=1 Tax=Salinimonas profundi TaxID=2729140 RepID=A0ABR8LGA5_9ALTE|nr:hypothetical protein [Salinimonas profundi]MBD3584121.1 hypothetical protein [Salinimonas profundi]